MSVKDICPLTKYNKGTVQAIAGDFSGMSADTFDPLK